MRPERAPEGFASPDIADPEMKSLAFLQRVSLELQSCEEGVLGEDRLAVR